uniref:Uncharacterized protein n=1 Tax=Oryza meridionalis TaxID=40149 RepID=A0A0E0EPS3_9ORYZ
MVPPRREVAKVANVSHVASLQTTKTFWLPSADDVGGKECNNTKIEKADACKISAAHSHVLMPWPRISGRHRRCTSLGTGGDVGGVHAIDLSATPLASHIKSINATGCLLWLLFIYSEITILALDEKLQVHGELAAVDPAAPIKEIRCCAWRTKNGSPWEIVLCIYDFPQHLHSPCFRIQEDSKGRGRTQEAASNCALSPRATFTASGSISATPSLPT